MEDKEFEKLATELIEKFFKEAPDFAKGLGEL